MRHTSAGSLIAAAVIALTPLVSHADEENKLDEVFKTACVKSWMEGTEKVTDKVAFKNFGEKYCDCAAGQPLNNDAAIDKAAKMCMSHVLLRDTMDTIEANNGLNDLTDAGFKVACANEWKLISPELTGSAKESAAAFCSCASTKLLEVNKNRDDVTDQGWYKKIDGIANDCTGTSDSSVKPAAKPATTPVATPAKTDKKS